MDRSGIYRSPKVRIYWVRTQQGEVRAVHSLAHMAQLLSEGRITPRDQISVGDGVWKPLEDLLDARGLAETLARLGHLDAGEKSA